MINHIELEDRQFYDVSVRMTPIYYSRSSSVLHYGEMTTISIISLLNAMERNLLR